MNLRDLRESLGLQIQQVADLVESVYGRVYTAERMDERGEIPARKAVGELQVRMREALEQVRANQMDQHARTRHAGRRGIKVQVTETGELAPDASSLDRYQALVQRNLAPLVSRGAEVELEWQGYTCGDSVKVDGAWMTFHAWIRTASGHEYVQAFQADGGYRCMNPEKVAS